MKNVKNVNIEQPNYWQIDHKIENICETKGVEILPSGLAWEKHNWTRKYFSKKPKTGYFIWIKERIDAPLLTCISIATKNIKQGVQNLLVVEKNLKVNLQGTCNSLKKDLAGVHKAQGKIILKENSTLEYNHIHFWGGKDIVETNYKFLLEKNSKLNYTYKILSTPKILKINTLLTLLENSSANLDVRGIFLQTKARIQDTLILKQKNASGVIKLRLAGRKNSEISTNSQVFAEAESKGHLDCQGLLVGKDSKVSLTPKLVCRHKKAQITHEASIGKISEEALGYLRTRGLSEKEAINLIVNGFLEK